jgi:hypothetical protein
MRRAVLPPARSARLRSRFAGPAAVLTAAALSVVLGGSVAPAVPPASGRLPAASLVDPAAGPEPVPAATSVLAVSIDGLNPRAIRRLGRERTPVLHRLRRTGASTLNARTAVELTETLPNHTTMVTSRRIDAARGGHGVTWNDERTRPRTVQAAAGHDVSSVFRQVHLAGRRTALFASKAKLSLFERSWPDAVHRDVVRTATGRLARVVRRDLRGVPRALRFVHLSDPDVVGHRRGFMSPAYLDAVARVDRLLGTLLRTLRSEGIADTTVVVVTADHGGAGSGHGDPTMLANYRIPFLVRGPDVARGADLYALNPRYRDPGRGRPGYRAEEQPVRNGALGNLALDVLGIDAIPESGINARQDLRLRRP